MVTSYGLGEYLAHFYPQLGTTGLQMVVWAFCIANLYLFHIMGFVNSWCHLSGKQTFTTKDNSRNNFLVGLLALGEGWHNNHHRFPRSERQGLFWWQVDISHYILTVMSWLGLVYDIKQPTREEITKAMENR
ncbi:MAG: fatty acid desaturase [SAR324 cluster bacterium]|nr:fatty acid desaturase [SAR324 cluster bacterium]